MHYVTTATLTQCFYTVGGMVTSKGENEGEKKNAGAQSDLNA